METNSYGDEQNSREKVKAYWVSLLNGARSDHSFEKSPGPSSLNTVFLNLDNLNQINIHLLFNLYTKI